MSITIRTVTGNELHVTYPRQSSPQKCYVELDARDEGTLSAAANPEIGNGIPFSVHHGHVQRWTIVALKADAANGLLTEIEPLADRVVAGYSSEWNGNNHVASYTDDATAAIEEIGTLCEQAGGEGESLSVWTADDWFGGLGSFDAQARELGITTDTTDEQLDEIGTRVLSSARADNVDEISGMAEHLRWIRKRVQEEAA